METREFFSTEGLYINDFHRKNSMAAQLEVLQMSLHPYSREQMLQQINLLHQSAVSKELKQGGVRHLSNVMEIPLG